MFYDIIRANCSGKTASQHRINYNPHFMETILSR